MKKKILGVAATLTLLSSIALAAPQSGVYQQMYADGRLKSVVTILHNPGTADFMSQYSLGDNTYVCFDALDNNGYEIENYASKLEETSSGYAISEKCFVINTANLYETARNVNLFEEGTGANTYRISQYDFAPWVNRVELQI